MRTESQGTSKVNANASKSVGIKVFTRKVGVRVVNDVTQKLVKVR